MRSNRRCKLSAIIPLLVGPSSRLQRQTDRMLGTLSHYALFPTKIVCERIGSSSLRMKRLSLRIEGRFQ